MDISDGNTRLALAGKDFVFPKRMDSAKMAYWPLKEDFQYRQDKLETESFRV